MTDESTPIRFTATDLALIDAYKALSVFATDDSWKSVVAENDPKAHRQALDAIAAIEQALPVPVLLTILPTYTKVRFTINGGTVEGQLREGAWGLQAANRSAVYARRITTTMGFETWIGPDTTIERFEVVDAA